MVEKANTRIIGIARRYAERIREDLYPASAVYLFGSYAKNTYHEDSDIDIAIITNSNRTVFTDELRLTKLRRGIDSRIEPHVIDSSLKDSPFAQEIFDTGIRIE